jgi:5'-deoxynucleotidase YfbR-like HD superfamily hydrolase
MNSLTTLFRLLEVTRAQTQYGYALSGVPKADLSDLAQHHYLVTMITWQLARMAMQAGGKVDLAKALEFGLIHDLGELFGGDISMPYAKANPAAKKFAKQFEEENQRFLSQYFADDAEHFKELSKEIMDAHSDEALISKIADYMEVTHYKAYIGRQTPDDVTMMRKKIAEKLDKISDPVTKKTIGNFAEQWAQEMLDDKGQELFEDAKSL